MSALTASAKANLDAAQIHLENAKAQYDSARANFESARKLYEATVVFNANAMTGNSRQKLCDSCGKIDFNALFRHYSRKRKPKPTSRRVIGSLFNTVENQSSCPCCHFLLEACQLGRAPGDIRLHNSAEAKNAIYLCDDPDDKPWFTKAGIAADLPWIPYYWIQIGPPSKTGEPYVCISLESSNIETDDASEPCVSSLPRLRGQVEAFNGSVNMDVIQAWVATCNQHEAMCGRPIFREYVYYLIDVHTRHIVRALSGCRYIALSYVWGKEAHIIYQRERIEVDLDSLNDSSIGWKVPYPAAQTIEDAMRFVKNLGETFLWTDLYCIDQNDDVAKQEQIMHMDKIYASSYLTIIALDGENADWGLPGVSRPLENTKQPTLTLGIGRLTATYIFSIYHHLGKSKWDSRAWTLQERLMSRRCIVFAKSSISMRCQEEVFHDSMRVAMTDTRPRVLTKLDEDRYWEDGSTINLNESSWDYKQYDSLISTYTSRDLTDQKDALNACRGVLNVISKNTGQGFIFGLPVEDLHRALLWKPHYENTVTRREGFPSWSWAGWIGRIEYAYWIGDMADYVTDDVRRPRKRVCSLESVDPLLETRADILFVPRTEVDGGIMRLSSEVARFYLCLQRTDGEMHIGLKPHSLQPSHAVGDHWTLIAGKAGTRKLRDTACEHEVFETADFFFRIHPRYRSTLENFKVGRRPADFLLVQKWPYIRDSKSSGKWRENMVSALLINENINGTYERLASILIPWREWQLAEPHRRVIELV